MKSIHNEISVAVIGAGYWGRNLIRNFFELGSLRAICDSDEGALLRLGSDYKGVKTHTSAEKILEDPSIQAVSIATPAGNHASMARDALLAGKDVLVEKPLALSLVEGRELVELASREGRILMVGHLLWYHPAMLKLKELVESGELGRLQYIYSHRLNLGRFRQEENILWSFAPHDISAILGLVGEEPDQYLVQGGYYLHNQIADITVSTLSFPSGVCAHIFVSWLHPFKEQRLVVVGSQKMAVFNDLEKENKLQLYSHTVEWRDNVPTPNPKDAVPVEVEGDEPLRLECEHFLECVATRSTPRTDGKEGLRVLAVLRKYQEALERARKSDSEVSGPAFESQPEFSDSVFIHPTATVDRGAEILEVTKIWHYSHVMRGARIGKNCSLGQNVYVGSGVVLGDNVKIQNNVSLYEGVELEDEVFCGPSMVFTNVINPRSGISRKDEFQPTLVKRGATLGANCTVICGNGIGRHAFVGAGAVVTKDVPDFGLVLGNPGRLVGWMCRCGVRLDLSPEGGMDDTQAECKTCGDRYRREGGRVMEASRE